MRVCASVLNVPVLGYIETCIYIYMFNARTKYTTDSRSCSSKYVCTFQSKCCRHHATHLQPLFATRNRLFSTLVSRPLGLKCTATLHLFVRRSGAFSSAWAWLPVATERPLGPLCMDRCTRGPTWWYRSSDALDEVTGGDKVACYMP